MLLAALAIIRWRLLRRLARERVAAARWNPLLAQCAEGAPAELPPLRTREAEFFVLLWCRAQESVRGEAQEHLRGMALRLGAGRHMHRLLRSRKLRLELLALVALGHMRDPAAVPLLEALIPAAPSLVSLTAAQALLRIDVVVGLPQIVVAVALRGDWPLARVVSMLKECDSELVGPIVAAAIGHELRRQAHDDHAIARLLRLHVVCPAQTMREAVLDVIQSAQSPEALAAALGALAYPQDAVHARRLLQHDGWIVRLAAVRALGRFGGPEDSELLVRALSDPVWWIRYRAAQALGALPGGADALRALPARLSDRFAVDIVRQVLAESGAA
jgi:HEAT repeat protein